MSRLAVGPRLARVLAASALLLVGACGESDPSTPTTAPSGPTAPPSDTSKPAPVPPRSDYIYLADADGTVRGRLTEGSWPSWSPDGRRLAFMRNGRVLVIDADGSNEKDLAGGAWPTWSPDGSLIAFVVQPALGVTRAIQVMSPDGSAARTLLAPTVNLYDPCYAVGFLAWAPDGASIAFVTSNCEWPAKIALVSADGTGERRLTAPTPGSEVTDEWGPAWSPDGSRLVYVHVDFFTGDGGLSIIDRNGGDNRPLDAGLHAHLFSRPAWSPDGRAIMFASPDGSIMIVPSSGGSPWRLILDGRQAAWSADGKRIAFVRNVER